MFKVICVLRSGGAYKEHYVNKLYHAVKRNLKMRFEFICLTDLVDGDYVKGVNVKPLQTSWKGWWAKLEMFFEEGPCLYLDLDTVIVNDITPLARAIKDSDDGFFMLKPFKVTEEWASGVVGWNRSNVSFIPDLFGLQDAYYTKLYKWEQRYIVACLKRHDIEVTAIQEHAKIHSYKHHCKEGLPEDAEIICFHGRPRPHEVMSIDWMQENWK